MCQFLFLFSLFITIISNQNNVYSARILGIFPVPSISHQVVFRALTYELAKRGHELVVVTPNPGLPKDRPKDNITEIDTSDTYQGMEALFLEANLKRGCVHRPEDIDPENNINVILIKLIERVFDNPEVKSILEDSTQKFDLIISEALYTSPLLLGKHFKAPVIWFSSFYGTSINYEAFGVPSAHPLLSPKAFRTRYYNLTLWEKIYQSLMHFILRLKSFESLKYEMPVIEKYYQNLSNFSFKELWDSVDLLLINANAVFDNNRPVPPNVVHLGGLHMQPRNEIPMDIQTFLDDSNRGVVYFSFGSNVRFELMDNDLIEVFIGAVEALPFDVLWKTDKLDLPRIPSNARIDKWFPQRDLLHHPNVKAFITQGGLQSADETIDAGVPVVVLPMLGDQWYNAEQYVRLGVGIQLDVLTLQRDELVKAVKTVIEDESYRKNMKRLSSIVRDQPETPLERAVWWTEYVLRHRGAKHLRSAAANISWREYLMLDVVLVLLAVLLIALLILGLITRFALGKLMKGRMKWEKPKKN